MRIGWIGALFYCESDILSYYDKPKPKQCPLCLDQNWDFLEDISSLMYNHFTCPNYSQCRLTLILTNEDYFIKKTLLDGTEIWWSNILKHSYLRLPQSGYHYLTFDLPLNIDETRLKILLLFS